MGICESQNQSESLEKGNIKGNGKEIPVIHTIIQPIIHQQIQPIITKNIIPIIREIIIPVFVRNEMEAQNIPGDLILNHPDVKMAMSTVTDEERQLIKRIHENKQQQISPQNNGTISENVPQKPKEEFEEPIPHKEYEPALKKDVGKLRHYVKLVEKHIDHKIIQDITEQEIKVATRPHIVPVLYP